jgi:ubiquinol-cytochrome c reductase iron-sulfur subunit
LAGRVYAKVPAPTNMVVPPYRYLGENLIIVGDDTGVTA